MNPLSRKYVQFQAGLGHQTLNAIPPSSPSAFGGGGDDIRDTSVERTGGGGGFGLARKEAELNAEERQYLMLVERGDVPSVLHILQTAKRDSKMSLNRDCLDPFGRTALMIAIENDNIDMISVLLRAGVALGDALLHAISEDNVEATQLLLAQPQTAKTVNSSIQIYDSSTANKDKVAKITAKWRKLTAKRELSSSNSELKSSNSQESLRPTPSSSSSSHPVSSSFSPDITPVVMAAHRDNYEILKILLDRGDKIPKPHDVRCSCADCVTKSSEDSLNQSRSRINAYRALASPSLMALSSRDPVLTAFELSWELRILSKLENELKRDYETLAKQCEDFAVDILDQVRGSKELEILLNYNAHSVASNDNGQDFRMNLDRLKLAIKYKQKRFVANASCQQLLASLWYEGLLDFRRRHVIFKILLTVSVSFLFPVLSAVYMVAPKTKIGQFMRRPFIKFICHSASYMTFLFLLILASQRIDSIINFGGGGGGRGGGVGVGVGRGGGGGQNVTDKKMSREVRGAPPTSIEWMILAYIAGLVWAEIKQLWDQGLKSYTQDMWNILDFTTNSLYIATYTLKLVAYLKVQEEKRLNNPAATASREHWDAFDPTLISEGLFAAANIFSSLKLIYIFTVNPHLGPLQISLGRMVIDILKFLFIALLVCFSYSCGVNQLYWYYAESRNRECYACEQQRKLNATIHCDCDTTLSNLFEIIQTLYFAVYGLVDITHFELREKHEFTQFVGKLMYGTYLGIMTVVLINMLIAMLSSSFQKISNDADTEWKFARSRLWMSYFEEGGTVPPPFNIIPTPKTVCYLVTWAWQRLCRCSKKARNNKWQTIHKSLKKKKERDTIYQSVIRELVKRYIMKRQRNTNEDGVNEDDINEIRQEISSFRFELLEVLRTNGMKVHTASNAQPTNTNSGRMRRKSSRMSLNKLCNDNSLTSSMTHQDSFPSSTDLRPPSSTGIYSPSSAPVLAPAPGSSSSNQTFHFSSSFDHVVTRQRSSESSSGPLHTLAECSAEEESSSSTTTAAAAEDNNSSSAAAAKRQRRMRRMEGITESLDSELGAIADEGNYNEDEEEEDDCYSSSADDLDSRSAAEETKLRWPAAKRVALQRIGHRNVAPLNNEGEELFEVLSDDV